MHADYIVTISSLCSKFFFMLILQVGDFNFNRKVAYKTELICMVYMIRGSIHIVIKRTIASFSVLTIHHNGVHKMNEIPMPPGR